MLIMMLEKRKTRHTESHGCKASGLVKDQPFHPYTSTIIFGSVSALAKLLKQTNEPEPKAERANDHQAQTCT